ncbi:MAG TPA: hypothetical protein VGS13_05780 [Stellaceae bacterium]|nr:hypothetical protein [Stellaceae bacterium]
MTETVTLGERRFEVRPLKLGQLRHLLDALDEMTGKSGGALIEAAARVVTAGLAPAQPELDPDAVLDLEASIEELNAAVAAVLRIAGLTPVGEARPVASPGDVPRNSSAPSTALSPPAALIPTASSTA